MSKLIKNRDGNFTHVKNDIFESGLSAKAMGIFCYLWHLPDDWKFYEDEIVTHFKDGKSGIRSGLKELQSSNFLVRKQLRDSKTNKIIGYDWQLNESPSYVNKTKKPLCDFPKVEKPPLEKPSLENRTLQSTKRTKYLSKQNTNVTNLSRSSATSNKKKEKYKTKLQSSYDDWTAKTNQQLTDLAMHYTKTRVANEQNELAYFNTLMEDWQSRNFETVTEVKDYLSSKNGSRSKQPKSNVIQPEWLSDDYVEPEPPKPTEADRARIKEMLQKFD